MSGKDFQQPPSQALGLPVLGHRSPIMALGLALLISTSSLFPAHAQSRVVIEPAVPVAVTGAERELPPMPADYGKPRSVAPMPSDYGKPTRAAMPSGYGKPRELPPMPEGYGEAKPAGTPPTKSKSLLVRRALTPVSRQNSAVVRPILPIQPQPILPQPILPQPIQVQPIIAPQAPVIVPQPITAPVITPAAPRILPQPVQIQPEPIVAPVVAPAPIAPAIVPTPITPTPITTPTPIQPAPIQQPAPVVILPEPVAAPAVIAPAPQPDFPEEPFELPVVKAPEVIAPAPEAVTPEVPAGSAIDQAIKDYGTVNAPTIPAPAPVLPEQPDASASDSALPVVVEPAAVAPVVEMPAAPLSDESKKILEKVPSGIDTPKKTHLKSPEPVVIKRNAPNAGVIPKLDYRAHEEMGLKIEVRKADPNLNRYLEQAYDNLIAGNYEIAEGYYEQVLALESKNEAALFGLATTYHKNGDLDSARTYYGKLLEINPTHREGLSNFMALISEESPQEALSELEKLEAANPDFSPVPAQMGMLYNQMGDPAKAAEKLTQALTLDPENISYKYNLAITLDKLGKKEAAADLYIELIEDYNEGANIPGDVEQMKNRAIFLSGQQ